MGTLRIIAGELRGRRIDVPARGQVRPTADRVREALFSILAPTLHDAVVLDAFSGSGALGFEALSRGARQATFIESDPTCVRALRSNAAGLGLLSRCAIHEGSVASVLRRARPIGPFDLILADPPYDTDQAAAFLPLAVDCLAPQGRVVVERDCRSPIPATTGLRCVRTARYGRNCLDFFDRAADAGG